MQNSCLSLSLEDAAWLEYTQDKLYKVWQSFTLTSSSPLKKNPEINMILVEKKLYLNKKKSDLR